MTSKTMSDREKSAREMRDVWDAVFADQEKHFKIVRQQLTDIIVKEMMADGKVLDE